MNWVALLISLSLLVITHELGHFCLAKLFHVRVRRFYLFFNWGFSIFKAKKFDGRWHVRFFNATTPESWDEKNLSPADRNNTLWGIGWLPFGGYCDIDGMIDESKSAKDLPSEPQPWEFRSKPAWQRLCIVSGGVVVNFLSALIIYGCIFSHWGKDELPLRNARLGYDYSEPMLEEGFCNGDILYALDGREVFDFNEAGMALLVDNPHIATVLRGDSLVDIALSGHLVEKVSRGRASNLMIPRVPFVVATVLPHQGADKAGLQAGDSVVSIGGKPMTAYTDIRKALDEHADESIQVGYYRHGRLDSTMVQVDNEGKIGVQLEGDITRLFEVKHTSYTLLQAIPAGIQYGWSTLVDYVSSLRIIFSPSGWQSLGGFGTMSSIFPNSWSWQSFWSITAMLALVLAFMNIIPIPGLDGGHIVFTLWEIITGRKPRDAFLTTAQNIGTMLLLLLMVVANGNDIVRWLFGGY